MFETGIKEQASARPAKYGEIIFVGASAILAGAVGLLTAARPEFSLLIAALPFALIAHRLPIANLLLLLLIVRTLTDNLSAGGTTIGVSAAVSGLLIAIGVGCMISDFKGIGITIVVVVSLVLSNQIAVSTFGDSMYREAVRTISIVMVFYIAFTVRPRIGDFGASRAVVVIGIIPALFAIYQWGAGLGFLVGGDIRPAGTLAHPNSAGLLFAICGLCAVYMTIERYTWLRLSTAIVFLVALLATASITSLFSYLAMLVSLSIFHPRIRSGLRLRLGAGFAAGLLAVAYTPVLSRRLAGLFEEQEGSSSTKSLDWRLDTWSDLWASFSDSPILGKGLGATTTGLVVKGNVPHNEYIRLLVETGFVGALVVLAVVIWVLNKLYRMNKREEARPGVALLISLLFGLMVSSISANTFLYSIPAFCVAYIFGATLSSAGFASSVQESVRDGRQSGDRVLISSHSRSGGALHE